jgi:hypothetical protein
MYLIMVFVRSKSRSSDGALSFFKPFSRQLKEIRNTFISMDAIFVQRKFIEK